MGRGPELQRLGALYARGPLAVLVGPAGMGKSSLAQAAFADRRDEVVVVGCDPARDLGACLHEALCPDAPSLGAGEAFDDALGAAELAACVVVVEDLHRLADGDRWLDRVARFARRSRWLFTTRRAPGAERAAECLIALGPLEHDAAGALARQCAPSLDEAAMSELLREAGGSPLRIRLLAAKPEGPLDDDPLAGLSPATLRYLATLAIEGGSAPLEPVHEAGAPFDSLRATLSASPARAAAMVDANLNAWIDAGLGADLWVALEEGDEPTLRSAKLRVAAEVGSRRSLEWLAEQSPPEPLDDRLVWARGMVLAGFSQRVVDALEHLPPGTHFEAELLLGDALCSAGSAERSVRRLEAMGTDASTEPTANARRELLLAKARYHAGDSAGAKEALLYAEHLLRQLASSASPALGAERTALRIKLGLRNEPLETEPLPREPPGDFRSRIYQGLRLAVSGRFGRSAALLDALHEGGDLPASGRLLADVGQGLLRITRGRYGGLPQLARSMVLDAERLGNATLYHWSFLLERLVNLGHSLDAPEIPWSATIPLPTGIPHRYLMALRASHALRRGETVAASELPRAQLGDGPLVGCICDLTAALAEVVGGDADRAALLADDVTERTVRMGYFFFEGEALLILCYAHLRANQSAGLREGLERLEGLADTLRSARYRSLARLLRGAFATSPDVQELLAIAAAADASPMAARVARALLGEDAPLDALDQRLVEGLRARWSRQVVPARGSVEWVFDPESRVIHRERQTVRLSPLSARLLECLFEAFERGGDSTVLSLEHLARQAWGIEEYHQLRDSKRVHVAMRRLRTVLEEDASAPSRLLTVEGGYALSLASGPGRLAPVAP